MISGKLLADQLNKFLKSPVCQNARVQVKLPQGEFHSPDGYFDIYMRINSGRLTFLALPVPVYQNSGFGVSGCYNPQTGASKLVEQTKRLGRSVPLVSC